MPLVSFVVPAYGVEAYLGPGLDSILSQSFTDFEVIVIDDCSPDRCGEIIDEYAARDSRVRPVHLERNGGLGPARNAGFAHASGDYSWFVDGDDWLAPDALAAIEQRLSYLLPDVLVIDYARAYLDGSTKRNINSHLLASAPKNFHIEEYPALLANFGVAWNKVVRTGFLRKAEIPFPIGWYEDIPFTYPLLARAPRISVLDQVCLYYRQRRHGGILCTTSPRHIELFDQYDRALARLDEGVVSTYVRDYAVGHGLLVLNAKGRLPRPARGPFFKRLKRFRAEHGVAPPGWKQRVQLAGGWRWWPYARDARDLLRTRIPAGDLGRKLRRAPGLAYYWAQRRLPLEDLAVYSSYWGRAYECSPAAIHAKARELVPQVRGVWLVNAEQRHRLPPGVESVVIGSFGYYRALARARWAIYNDNLEGEVVKRHGSVHVQTHHGTPLKGMGVDEPGVDLDKLLKRCDRWDYSLSSSRYATGTWARAYPCRFTSLEYGSPRNDVLVNGPARGTGMVLYAPTFRAGMHPPAIDGLDVVMKRHYFDESGPQPPIEELLLKADVLITDYSSVMFDFALLDRPIVIYAPDWQSYVDTRGVYFDLLRDPPGLVATTEAELRDGFASGAVWEFGHRLRAFRERFCQFDDGKAAERVVRKVFLGEEPC